MPHSLLFLLIILDIARKPKIADLGRKIIDKCIKLINNCLYNSENGLVKNCFKLVFSFHVSTMMVAMASNCRYQQNKGHEHMKISNHYQRLYHPERDTQPNSTSKSEKCIPSQSFKLTLSCWSTSES